MSKLPPGLAHIDQVLWDSLSVKEQTTLVKHEKMHEMFSKLGPAKSRIWITNPDDIIDEIINDQILQR